MSFVPPHCSTRAKYNMLVAQRHGKQGGAGVAGGTPDSNSDHGPTARSSGAGSSEDSAAAAGSGGGGGRCSRGNARTAEKRDCANNVGRVSGAPGAIQPTKPGSSHDGSGQEILVWRKRPSDAAMAAKSDPGFPSRVESKAGSPPAASAKTAVAPAGAAKAAMGKAPAVAAASAGGCGAKPVSPAEATSEADEKGGGSSSHISKRAKRMLADVVERTGGGGSSGGAGKPAGSRPDGLPLPPLPPPLPLPGAASPPRRGLKRSSSRTAPESGSGQRGNGSGIGGSGGGGGAGSAAALRLRADDGSNGGNSAGATVDLGFGDDDDEDDDSGGRNHSAPPNGLPPMSQASARLLERATSGIARPIPTRRGALPPGMTDRSDQVVCGICQETADRPHSAACNHVCCRECWMQWLRRPAEGRSGGAGGGVGCVGSGGIDGGGDGRPCPMCRAPVHASALVRLVFRPAESR
ncbi:unnamed protein product [Phaeothamnion confervicola]